jgi:hypothetical protein
MMKGNNAILGVFVVGIILLIVFFSWGVVQPMLVSFTGGDPSTDFIMWIAGAVIVLAVILSFFGWMNSGGQSQ